MTKTWRKLTNTWRKLPTTRSISSLLQGRQPRFTSANVTALCWLAIILSGAYGDHSQLVGVGAVDSFMQRVDTFAQE
jgi:hypothetical protein